MTDPRATQSLSPVQSCHGTQRCRKSRAVATMTPAQS